MRAPSLWQILIIVLIILILFGAKRLPDVASSIGQSLKIFKKEVTELRGDEDAAPGGTTGTTGTTAAQQPPPGSSAGSPGQDPGTSTTPPSGTGTDRR